MRRSLGLFMEEYIITDIISETADTSTIRFINKLGEHCNFQAGQLLTINIPEQKESGKTYSISSIQSDEFISITVKAVGDLSRKLCNLKKGDKILASKLPYGHLFEDIGAPLVCIAGGVGIAPIWSIIRSVLESDADRDITLINSNKKISDITFQEQINKITKCYQNFKHIKHITQQDNSIGNCFFGRISDSEVSKLIAKYKHPEIIICGSQDFVNRYYKSALLAGVSARQISTEALFQ